MIGFYLTMFLHYSDCVNTKQYLLKCVKYGMENLKASLYRDKAGIYSIRSIKTKKVYIGSSVNLYKRINLHIKELLKGSHINRYLLNHYNKYGNNDLVVDVLECIIKSSDYDYKKYLIEREQYYLDLYYGRDKCFNLHHKAIYFQDNPKARKNQAKKIKVFWQENYDIMKLKVTENLIKARKAERKSYKAWNKGLKTPNSVKQKQSLSAKNRKTPSKLTVIVYQYNIDGSFIKEWDSSKTYCKSNNLKINNSTNINACCRNKRDIAFGYLWSYIKKDNYYE